MMQTCLSLSHRPFIKGNEVFPLIVVDNPKTWPLHIPGASVIAARSYLTDPVYSELRNARVFNLCRSYRYQSTGYYVSLLAMARGHKPLPNITTIQDMKSFTIIRLASDDLEDVLQSSLRPIHSHSFTLSIYFGRNLAKRYDALSAHLFRTFQSPFLQADFAHDEEDGWRLRDDGSWESPDGRTRTWPLDGPVPE